MSSCKNCFLTIDDGRKETHCIMCNAPLHKECAIVSGGNSYCDVCFTIKTEDDIISTPSFIVPETVRRSHIELYRSCPYAFYLEVIKGLQITPSSYAQLGIDLHELFEKASKGELNVNQLTEEFNKRWETYDDKMFQPDLALYKDMDIPRLRIKLKEQMYDAIDTFFNILPTLPQNAYALEENIIFNIGEDLPNVSITMDRVDEVDGELEVCDWKTGAVIVGQKLSSDLQAPLYIYAVREHFKKPVRKFTFYYLPENKIRIFERIDADNYECTVNKRKYKINITDSIREVQHVFSQIKNGNFNIPRDTRGMYFKCKTCSFKKNEQCQGADVESWKQHN